MKTSRHQHYILHKPYGVLSQFVNNQTRRKNKSLLGDLYDFAEGTMAIGRLDEASEGLLLLTTDGKVSEAIRSATIEKEYHVQVDGIIDITALSKLQEGVEIGLDEKKYTTKPCIAFRIDAMTNYYVTNRKIRDQRHGPTSWVGLVLTEGKFRQVRKMTAAVGFPTLRLIRVRIGSIHLEVPVGTVQEVDGF